MKLCLNLLKRNTKGRGYFFHIDDLVWLNVGLESLDSDLLVHLGGCVCSEIGIILEFLLNNVELTLKLLESTKHEIFKAVNSVWVLLEE